MTTLYTLFKTAAFLNAIGLPTTLVDTLEQEGFLPGVWIHHGTLHFTTKAQVGDLLHDAGHLAVIPSSFRSMMHGNLYNSLRQILSSTSALDPEDPTAIAVMQADDLSATAWGWACGIHLGIDPKLVIPAESYGNSGDEIRGMLTHNRYLGIHGLQRSGFCSARAPFTDGSSTTSETRPIFPKLAFWLHP